MPLLAFALAPACGGDTGIVLEVSMSPGLVAELDASGEDFETLRIWVGQATEDPSFFTASGEAFFNTGRTRADLTVPFRYLLEPTGELAAIGPMVFAAAVGDDPDDARLPFRITGFAVADDPMGFADDQVRVVPLALAPPDGAQATIDDGCIIWGTDTQDPSRITPADDLDCDGAIGGDDCNDHDPSQNNLDRDGDSVSSCAGDCMDDPLFETPWLDPAAVYPGAPDPGENDPNACSHVDFDCDGNCGAAANDDDASGPTGVRHRHRRGWLLPGAARRLRRVARRQPAARRRRPRGMQRPRRRLRRLLAAQAAVPHPRRHRLPLGRGRVRRDPGRVQGRARHPALQAAGGRLQRRSGAARGVRRRGAGELLRVRESRRLRLHRPGHAARRLRGVVAAAVPTPIASA